MSIESTKRVVINATGETSYYLIDDKGIQRSCSSVVYWQEHEKMNIDTRRTKLTRVAEFITYSK